MFVGVSFCRCTFGFSILWPFLLFHIRLLGLADSLYDEIKSLPLEEDFGEQTSSFSSGSRKLKKRKVFHSIRWTYIYVMFSIATLAFAYQIFLIVSDIYEKYLQRKHWGRIYLPWLSHPTQVCMPLIVVGSIKPWYSQGILACLIERDFIVFHF